MECDLWVCVAVGWACAYFPPFLGATGLGAGLGLFSASRLSAGVPFEGFPPMRLPSFPFVFQGVTHDAHCCKRGKADDDR
jgi:hypothetical protein